MAAIASYQLLTGKSRIEEDSYISIYLLIGLTNLLTITSNKNSNVYMY